MYFYEKICFLIVDNIAIIKKTEKVIVSPTENNTLKNLKASKNVNDF